MATTLKVTALIIQKKYIYPTGQAKMIFTIWEICFEAVRQDKQPNI
jgi:hypothetical protein